MYETISTPNKKIISHGPLEPSPVCIRLFVPYKLVGQYGNDFEALCIDRPDLGFNFNRYK